MSDQRKEYLRGRAEALDGAHRVLKARYGYVSDNGEATPSAAVLWDLGAMADKAKEQLHREGG